MGDTRSVAEPFPSPTNPVPSRADVFLGYLDFFRSTLIAKVAALPDADARTSRLPSGWTPAELVKHVTFVELRWLDWGFLGNPFGDPWGDQRDDRWFVAPGETTGDLLAALRERGARTREIVESTGLDTVGRPGPRWDGDDPPTLERILFHLVQEYARHTGHLDIVAELAGGPLGE